ncbi:family 16 glycoside hydrolase [Streptomyces sp. NPDC001215]
MDQFRKDGIIDNREAATLSKEGAQSPIGKTPGYKSIFDGSPSSLAGWSQAGAGTFSLLPDGTMRSSGGMGMLWYSKQQFKDYSIRLQFRDLVGAPVPPRKLIFGSTSSSGSTVRPSTSGLPGSPPVAWRAFTD